MALHDPVSDLLTRLRNAAKAGRSETLIPHSSLKANLAKIMLEEGYIKAFDVSGDKIKTIRVVLKYRDKTSAFYGLKQISKPGLRVYADVKDLPRVLNGLGIAIISTSAGMMTDKQARLKNVGGEVLAYVW